MAPLAASATDDNDDAGTKSGSEGGTGWIKNAMGDDGATTESEEKSQAATAPLLKSLDEGLAGFAVDPELGFVAIVASSSNSGDEPQRWTYSVVSPKDTDELSSAEALTLVQLAGGIDVGAAVLPPDVLLRIVRDEVDDDDDGYDNDDPSDTSVRLLKCEAVPPSESQSSSGGGSKTIEVTTIESSPEREAKIASDAPRLRDVILKLPGLGEATEESVQNAMLVRAASDGSIGREEFENILGDLRLGTRGRVGGDLAGAEFALSVGVSDRKGEKEPRVVEIRAPSTFQAVGLSMRYERTIEIREGDNKFGGVGTKELLERFPAFRPMVEFRHDVEDVDGMLPGMFFKENAPRAFE